MCKCQSPLISTNLHVKFHILFAIVGSFYFTVLMQTLSAPCKYFLELFSLCFGYNYSVNILTASRQTVFFHDVVQSAKKNLIYLKCMFDAVKSQ